MEFLGHPIFESAATSDRAGHALRVDAPHGDDLTVVSFEGEEALSRPFAFEVVVATSHDLDGLARELLGAEAAFTLAPERDGPSRVIHGVVADVHTGLPAPSRGLARARLRIVPRVALAAHRRDTRVFQDTTVPTTLATTLRAYGVELGQIVFLAGVLSIGALARRAVADPSRARRWVVEAVGACSVMWLLQRVMG